MSECDCYCTDTTTTVETFAAVTQRMWAATSRHEVHEVVGFIGEGRKVRTVTGRVVVFGTPLGHVHEWVTELCYSPGDAQKRASMPNEMCPRCQERESSVYVDSLMRDSVYVCDSCDARCIEAVTSAPYDDEP